VLFCRGSDSCLLPANHTLLAALPGPAHHPTLPTTGAPWSIAAVCATHPDQHPAAAAAHTDWLYLLQGRHFTCTAPALLPNPHSTLASLQNQRQPPRTGEVKHVYTAHAAPLSHSAPVQTHPQSVQAPAHTRLHYSLSSPCKNVASTGVKLVGTSMGKDTRGSNKPYARPAHNEGLQDVPLSTTQLRHAVRQNPCRNSAPFMSAVKTLCGVSAGEYLPTCSLGQPRVPQPKVMLAGQQQPQSV
jgi:hypothetical protein